MRSDNPETMETEMEKLKRMKSETNAQATQRIGQELRNAKMEDARRDTVYDYFFTLTGQPMNAKQYAKYMQKFNSRFTPKGYNLKSFIRDEKIEIDHKVLMQTADEFMKEQLIELQVDKILGEEMK